LKYRNKFPHVVQGERYIIKINSQISDTPPSRFTIRPVNSELQKRSVSALAHLFP